MSKDQPSAGTIFCVCSLNESRAEGGTRSGAKGKNTGGNQTGGCIGGGQNISESSSYGCREESGGGGPQGNIT
jgi:hypothetical protein